MNRKEKSPFNLYSQYYDLLYKDKDYQGEVDYILELIQKYNSPSNKILELGSGTGKHGKLIADKGYKVTGIERSKEMLSKAVQTVNFNCQLGDICKIKLNQKFGSIISLFHVLSYQTENKNIMEVFKVASEHLNKNGLFIFDVWYSPAVNFIRPETRVNNYQNENISVTRIAEPEIFDDENKVNVKYKIICKNLFSEKIEIFNEVHPMRHFSTPELNLLALHNGLEYIHNEEFFTKEAPSKNTWGVCYIYRKS